MTRKKKMSDGSRCERDKQGQHEVSHCGSTPAHFWRDKRVHSDQRELASEYFPNSRIDTKTTPPNFGFDLAEMLSYLARSLLTLMYPQP